MNVYSQGKIFCIFFLVGLIINFLFDIFRALRKSFKTKNIIVFIEDIVFLCISGFIFFRSLIIFNDGEIRLFVVLAVFMGILIYSLTISSHCVIIITVILKNCKKMAEFFLKIIFLPFFIIKNKIMKKQREKTKI